MTLTCVLVDDEPLALDLLESYVQKTPGLKLAGRYASALEALPALTQMHVDLLFLDIQMPDLSGLDLSRMLVPGHTRIVFTTAFSQYAVEGYKVDALDYLLKPIAYTDFVGAVTRAQRWFARVAEADVRSAAGNDAGNVGGDNGTAADARIGEADSDEAKAGMNAEHPVFGTGDNAASATDEACVQLPSHAGTAPDCLFVKSDYRLVRINLADLLYIEGLKDYVKIYTTDSPKPILSLTSLRVLESLLSPDRFVRTHRSHIVNMEHVKAVEKGQVLIGQKYIPVSDSYRDRVNEYINRRLVRR